MEDRNLKKSPLTAEKKDIYDRLLDTHYDERGLLQKLNPGFQVKDIFFTVQGRDVAKGFHGFEEPVKKFVFIHKGAVQGFIHDGKEIKNLGVLSEGCIVDVAEGQYWGFISLCHCELFYLVSEEFSTVTEKIIPIGECIKLQGSVKISEKDNGQGFRVPVEGLPEHYKKKMQDMVNE